MLKTDPSTLLQLSRILSTPNNKQRQRKQTPNYKFTNEQFQVWKNSRELWSVG